MRAYMGQGIQKIDQVKICRVQSLKTWSDMVRLSRLLKSVTLLLLINQTCY